MATLGRPSKYKPEYCEIARQMADEGRFQCEIAAALNVCEDTLYEWAKIHEDFSEALKTGKTKSKSHLVNMLMENAFTPGFNNTAIIYLLKSIHKMYDRETNNQVVIAVDSNSDIDKVAEMAKKIRKQTDC